MMNLAIWNRDRDGSVSALAARRGLQREHRLTSCRPQAFLPFLLGLVSIGAVASTGAAEDPFAQHVRPTDPLTPDEEQRSFHLPPGFEIQLFASEPDIAKPMNMAFDSQGRLWITESREYPFPVPLDEKGRDAIKILEDTDSDGRADEITTFTGGLNIPIGIYPYQQEAIAWSIPNLWHFQDTDGDWRADERKKLYGPLGWERDTHGMNNSFTRGFDGWLYITHGFNNSTTLRGADGHEIRMQSGNTYRVRLDGSRVEHYTWGQVNPFGLCFDPLGNLYSADCHSAPVYQLLRGGYYPSFGKPHDGLGFAPTLMQHNHGSTAIAGILYYADDKWPEEYRDNVFVGNVMTSRINRDALRFEGSSPVATKKPDFVRTDDPWFRPVNLQLGPDGALYVADFYNRIIGHYEVPLDHPGRDRRRGRIWRIVYRGEDPSRADNAGQTTPADFDVSEASAERLIRHLSRPNLTQRMLAMHELVDRIGAAAIEPVRESVHDASSTAYVRLHGLWVLFRLEALKPETLVATANDSDYRVRTHAMRVLAETGDWNSTHRELALAGLGDSSPHVQRAAADALGQHPGKEHVQPLLDLRLRVPESDDHLLHRVRMALRNQLTPEGTLAGLSLKEMAADRAKAVADVVVAIESAEAGSFLLRFLQRHRTDPETMKRYLRHAARHTPASQMDVLAGLVQDRFPGDVDLQLTLFQSVQQGLAERGVEVTDATRDWGRRLAARLLGAERGSSVAWYNLPVKAMSEPANPWILQRRSSADGDQDSWFLCSLPPGGEQLTGILRSRPFTIPISLEFYLAGHDGFPDQPPGRNNLVRLRLVETDEILARSYAPRNDTAQKRVWELDEHAGRQGYLEVVDRDDGSAYAWLAVGRFDPGIVPLPETAPRVMARRQTAAADLAVDLQLYELEPELKRLAIEASNDVAARAAAARALAKLDVKAHLSVLVSLLQNNAAPSSLQTAIGRALATSPHPDARAKTLEVIKVAPHSLQSQLAQAMAGITTGAEDLLQLMENGRVSAQLLQESSIREKILAAAPEDAKPRIQRLTENLPPVRENIRKLIDQKIAALNLESASLERGQTLFSQACAACHQVDGQGGLIGPQLDGIGNRGMARLLEDVLDPNRNVDQAFRTHVYVLKSGEVIRGLPRREEGELMIVADTAGREISIPKTEIQEHRESTSSLMPDNFGELFSSEDLNDLMVYLMSLR